jgi:hypothetical protein
VRWCWCPKLFMSSISNIPSVKCSFMYFWDLRRTHISNVDLLRYCNCELPCLPLEGYLRKLCASSVCELSTSIMSYIYTASVALSYSTLKKLSTQKNFVVGLPILCSDQSAWITNTWELLRCNFFCQVIVLPIWDCCTISFTSRSTTIWHEKKTIPWCS